MSILRSEYFFLPDPTLCSGCSACCLVCTRNAIRMRSSHEGFLYPFIDTLRCSGCGLCVSVCPVLHQNAPRRPTHTYAVRSKDPIVLSKSSSGGVFALLAKEILRRGGSVYGSAFEYPECNLLHIRVVTPEALPRLCGSKYLQSEIGRIYASVRNDVLAPSNTPVLFSGTPCQIAGLKAFLGKDSANLYCMDVICHGVPSPFVFQRYVSSLVPKRARGKIVRCEMRSKKTGWKNCCSTTYVETCAEGEFSEIVDTDNLYAKLFLSETISRKSCHVCKFRGLKSGSDITCGDFWGGEKLIQDWKDDKGISLAMVMTGKGASLFNCAINGVADYFEVDFVSSTVENPSLFFDKKPAFTRRFLFFFARIFPFKPVARFALFANALGFYSGYFKPAAIRRYFQKKFNP